MNRTEAKSIRLFIALEQRLYRDALLFDLVHQKDIELVGESSTGNETLKQLARCIPTTLVIEENLKDIDGLTIAEMALSQYPSLTIILIVDKSISKNRLAIYLDSGIKSVVSKEQSLRDLNQAVNYTRNGQIYISAEHYRTALKKRYSTPIKGDVPPSDRFETLSEREKEVATYIAENLPLSNIAERLGVSHKTVHTYKERIFEKLDFQRLPELIVFMKRLHFSDVLGEE